MSKLRVALVVGGAVVVAGYVFRKPLSSAASRYTDIAHGFVADLIEEAKQRNHDSLWEDDGSVDDFLSHPETGSVRVRPAAE